MNISKITFIDQANLENKHILLRVDFNVSLHEDRTIADDARIQQSLPTINFLLENHNKLILVSHLGRPKGREAKYSMSPVQKKLQEIYPDKKITMVEDFTKDRSAIDNQQENEIIILENIRFYPEEQEGTEEFAKKLSELADTYVNDAFGVSHRADASVVGITKFLPSFGGLLLKKEIEMISKITDEPKKPVVAILGGAKISTKIHLIQKLMEIADYLILGGGLANTFLSAQGYQIGKSICEYDEADEARKLLFQAVQKNTRIVFPSDVVISDNPESEDDEVKNVADVPAEKYILDIGPESQAKFGAIIAEAGTIVWNGPVGYFENAPYRRGTDFIYYSIAQNQRAVSVVGGGDTLAAISKKEYLDKITHISTGGGAMLEYIEKGTLPGIDALIMK